MSGELFKMIESSNVHLNNSSIGGGGGAISNCVYDAIKFTAIYSVKLIRVTCFSQILVWK